MSEMHISEEEAKSLLSKEKIATDDHEIDLPFSGGKIDMNFSCNQNREEFIISVNRSSLALMKRNHHLRGRKAIGLARLDLDGPPHRNPDGKEVGPRHLHIYRENYGLRFAFEVPEALFRNLDDFKITLEDFLDYCNVINKPEFKKSLFDK